MIMFEDVRKYEKAYNQICKKYPSSFRAFSDAKLKEFDETQTGTIKELTEKKKKYSEKLKAEYRELQKKEREEYNALENEFRERVYQQSYAKDFPNGRKIFDHLWSIAYDRGHSYGMQEVITKFDDIDENFHELTEIMNEKENC